MGLDESIKIYDNILPLNTLSTFIQWLNTQKFEHATTLGGLQREIRKAENLQMSCASKSQTMVHWHNILQHVIKKGINEYRKEHPHLEVAPLLDIVALKYEQTGFYKYHTDSSFRVPRTVSCIFLLNNDYEGGQLVFGNPKDNSELKKIEVRPNRLIVWPSNFLYPHSVLPVTKGKRYSVVAWAF